MNSGEKISDFSKIEAAVTSSPQVIRLPENQTNQEIYSFKPKELIHLRGLSKKEKLIFSREITSIRRKLNDILNGAGKISKEKFEESVRLKLLGIHTLIICLFQPTTCHFLSELKPFTLASNDSANIDNFLPRLNSFLDELEIELQCSPDQT